MGPARLADAPSAASAEIEVPPATGVNWTGLTVIKGLLLGLFAASEVSRAVTVKLPLVLRNSIRLLVPATRFATAGSDAVESLEASATLSRLVTRFQYTSTALTVTLNAVQALWPSGAPVLPDPLPGAAISPGTSNWSLADVAGERV